MFDESKIMKSSKEPQLPKPAESAEDVETRRRGEVKKAWEYLKKLNDRKVQELVFAQDDKKFALGIAKYAKDHRQELANLVTGLHKHRDLIPESDRPERVPVITEEPKKISIADRLKEFKDRRPGRRQENLKPGELSSMEKTEGGEQRIIDFLSSEGFSRLRRFFGKDQRQEEYIFVSNTDKSTEKYGGVNESWEDTLERARDNFKKALMRAGKEVLGRSAFLDYPNRGQAEFLLKEMESAKAVKEGAEYSKEPTYIYISQKGLGVEKRGAGAEGREAAKKRQVAYLEGEPGQRVLKTMDIDMDTVPDFPVIGMPIITLRPKEAKTGV